MMRFLHITFIWNATPKNAEQLRPILDIADDWLYYGGSNFIMYTDIDPYTWAERFRVVIDQRDSLFVCEIANINLSGGWLPQSVWDWIWKDRHGKESPQLLIPSS